MVAASFIVLQSIILIKPIFRCITARLLSHAFRSVIAGLQGHCYRVQQPDPLALIPIFINSFLTAFARRNESAFCKQVCRDIGITIDYYYCILISIQLLKQPDLLSV